MPEHRDQECTSIITDNGSRTKYDHGVVMFYYDAQLHSYARSAIRSCTCV